MTTAVSVGLTFSLQNTWSHLKEVCFPKIWHFHRSCTVCRRSSERTLWPRRTLPPDPKPTYLTTVLHTCERGEKVNRQWVAVQHVLWLFRDEALPVCGQWTLCPGNHSVCVSDKETNASGFMFTCNEYVASHAYCSSTWQSKLLILAESLYYSV